MLTPLELPIQSEPGRYVADGNARLINAMAEEVGRSGKVPFPVYATDGLTDFATLTNGGGVRGLIVSSGFVYAISGRQVFKVSASGVVTSLGGFAGDGPVQMAVNQKATPQILLVGIGVYGIVENDTLSPLADSDLQPPNSVAVVNQRFVTTTPGGRFQWSELAEGTEWGPLDFATAEYDPDGLQRAFVRKGELLLFGNSTIEPWYTPTSGDDVFLRSGTVIERGCLNGNTIARLEETPVFVADDKTVRALEGYGARRISTHAVERSIRDTATTENLTAFAYEKDGHGFYCLSGDDFSWVFDVRVGQWHERASYAKPRWRAQHYANLSGLHIVGDYETNKLYKIDDAAYGEGSDLLVMTVQIPVHAYPRRIEIHELFVDMVPGVGLNSTDEHNANPKLMVAVSKDGGATFGNERQFPIGRRGNRGVETKIRRLGISNEDGFVIRLSVSAEVARAITAVAVDYSVLGD